MTEESDGMNDLIRQLATPSPRTRASGVLFAGILALAGVFLGLPCHADDGEDAEAKKLYKKGVALAKQGEYEEAIEKFEEARTRGAPDETIFNIGKCYEALGLFYVAVQYYEEYLASPDAKMKDEIQATMKELALKPSTLTFTSEPPGAEVRQVLPDGSESKIGVTPFQHVAPSGDFQFAVHKEGFEKKVATITAGYGKPYDLRISLGAATMTMEVEVVETVLKPEKHEEAKPPVFPRLGLAIDLGGGVALHPHQGTGFRASGVFSIGAAWRFTLGLVTGFAVGLRLDLKSLKLTGVEYVSGDGGSWDAKLVDVLVVPSYQVRVHERLAVEASVPVGIAMIVPPDGMPSTARIDLLGGYMDGTLALFDAGVGLALRVQVVSGLHLVIEPVRLHVLVPLKKWPSGTGAIVDLDIAARAGFQF